jgi:periplasmic protein TonB
MMTSTRTGALVLSAWLAVLAGCTSTKSGVPAETSASSSEEKAAGEETPGRSEVAEVRLITAQTPAVRAYRKIGSGAIYKAYPTRIHKGKIPPLVYAVVVVETDIDATGKVVNVGFSRTPSHAPEVPPMIAELIRKASPLPSPGRLGAHTYVDTWLWDKSGTFQLDSRTLGQRSR